MEGLQAAAWLCEQWGEDETAARFSAEAIDFMQAIQSSIEQIPERRSGGCIPASPYRRMDAGAIGVLVALALLLLPEIARRRRDMPIGCLSQKIALSAELDCPRYYIHATRTAPGDPFDAVVHRSPRVAEEEGFDQIVLGGGQTSPMGKINIGSIAEFVLLNSHITVKLVR